MGLAEILFGLKKIGQQGKLAGTRKPFQGRVINLDAEARLICYQKVPIDGFGGVECNTASGRIGLVAMLHNEEVRDSS